MKRTYLSIGNIKNYNIKVIYGEQVIYEGLSDNVPDEYKDLKYNDISVSNGLITVYIENEM